ncbi:MAG TPA: AMP-binding protein [Alphaproteobacteria bacterium]|jgi:long-chain acyl-CoA synthetase|nr:AMP-binding protein [Alphaproteobacteria bacterium]MDP7164771.1 AMP-binding protein [Alphaproteobacteria bacterium]MDP7428260.1 AMP-binding protein [Alphaproteobacteria bacterium]HJM51005.1 AMP-binding protein [Alphaproteobacteria bacterium]
MTDRDQSIAPAETFAALLQEQIKRWPDAVAYREKYWGIWQSHTWAETAAGIRAMALGFSDVGLKRGEHVAIIGANRPELYWSFTAIQAMGGIPIPLYQDSIAEEMQYVLEHAEIRIAVCENQEQVDKILSVMERCPKIEIVIYKEPKGMRHYDQPFIYALRELMERGRALDAAKPDLYDSQVALGKNDDVALIAYTSGTTGDPKGVVLSFRALMKAAQESVALEGLNVEDEVLSYLPLAWVGDHFFSVAQAYHSGMTVNCPESSDTVMLDLKELGPTYFFAPPAIWEGFLTQIRIRMEDSGRFKKWLFDYFIGVAGRVGVRIMEEKPVSAGERFLYWLGSLSIYGPLRNNLGLSRVRIAYTAGAPLGEEVFDFYRSLGINLKQLYGQTESCAYVTLQRNGDVKHDTVGPPAPGCEVKIAENGEILFRSPGTFDCYYKNEEATIETKGENEGDWIHTGDAGIIDDSGHLKVIDRAKDVGTMNDGTLFAPQYLENKLKFHPFIKEAVTYGDQRDFVGAFINIDLEATGNWAERQGIAYTSYTDLADRDETYELIKGCVEDVNATLARDSALVGSQIRRFLILHKELDADDGEITRTGKVRRRIIAERFGDLIDGLYSDAERVAVEAKVTFEDGREGVIKANLKVQTSNTFDAMKKAS